MRPVNLLPPSQRVREGGRPGSAYVILGVLGALVVAVTMYVLTANQVTGKKDELAQVTAEAQAADARANALGSFGDFAQMRQTRETSVASLAQARLDWERLMHELSRVLPEDVYINSFDASAAGTPAGTTSGSTAPAGPTAKLAGCAPSQPEVATTMVRLRKLHRANDVKLTDTTRVAKADDNGSGGAGGGECTSGYGFTVVVSFDPAPATTPERVPAHLGGGA